MNIPEWAVKYKVPGTEIHTISGNYYLYKISSKWDPVKKRSQKITEKFLGTITQNGLVNPEKEIIKESLKNISVKEYACSHFIQTSNDNILETLQNYFPDWWKEIFISSFLRLMHSCPLKNFEFLYKQSFISEEIKGARMSKNSLTQMLNSVGGRREAIASLFKNYLWVANLY